MNRLLITLIIVASWNKDYKPDQFPKTEKQRTEAAKKYYLLPEEYRPYADNGLGYGDYPDLGKGLGIESKDPYYPYDFPEHKRNLHETVNYASSTLETKIILKIWFWFDIFVCSCMPTLICMEKIATRKRRDQDLQILNIGSAL